jgi:hypothetical protein
VYVTVAAVVPSYTFPVLDMFTARVLAVMVAVFVAVAFGE